MKDGFETCLNENKETGNRVARVMVKYLDNKLSSLGDKNMKLEPDDVKLIEVFRFVHAKDVFKHHYSKLLAKRLLSHNSRDIDDEEMVLASLKRECGG